MKAQALAMISSAGKGPLEGSVQLGTKVIEQVDSRATLLLDGLAPIYRRPSFQARCGPKVYQDPVQAGYSPSAEE